MIFEWDDHKDKLNVLKHGVDFRTAATLFFDPLRLEWFDYIHSDDEPRFITIGTAGDGITVLTVVYTERNGDIRIISARKATRREREKYYEGEIRA